MDVGAAASGGVRGGLTWVGEQESELLDLPVGSRVWSGPDSRRKTLEARAPWASMLTAPRGGGRRYAGEPAGAAPARGDGPIIIQLHLAGREFGQVVLDPLRQAIHHYGGNVQAVLGRPNGTSS
ncbi:hypothetical protein [Streptomyces sp. NPDC049915]|uniref:hypothetical protein n=1 Tax=Streptomyces sp. NPDC049915 TaxID=3155510 RepID=UPI003428698F